MVNVVENIKQSESDIQTPSLWITEAEFAARFGIPRETLRGWRHKDRKAGRTSAPEGYPQYRKWGVDLVRYFVGGL